MNALASRRSGLLPEGGRRVAEALGDQKRVADPRIVRANLIPVIVN